MTALIKTGYAPVNGLNLYYEIHGTGEPLILLHGGGGGIDMFGPTLPALSKQRKVIVIEFFAVLGGGQKDAGLDGSQRPAAQLVILPGLTHYNICSSPALATVVTPFLDTPMPGDESSSS